MSSKFSQWFKAVREQSGHAANATKADIARIDCVGKGRLVEKHLHRTSERESTLAQFVGLIANSPALNDEEDE